MFSLEISQEANDAILIALYLVGVVLRVFWPYVLKYLKDGTKFDVRYVIGEFLVSLTGLIVIFAGKDFLPALGLLGFFGAFAAGFGAVDFGRNLQKTVDATRS